ncbi:MAG: Na(+)/H(+) antiporter subunit B [Spirochaetota bacterium]
MSVLLLVLGILLIVSAAAAIFMKHIVSAIITAGVVSLIGSLLFLLVGAPDVAMTEAAIGSALTTVIFLFAWSRIRHLDGEHSKSRDRKGDTL